MKGLNMKMKITLTLLVIAIASACASTPDREVEGFHIPKADIMYQALNFLVSIQNESNNLIGFVNADGTGNTFIKLKYRAYTPVLSVEAGGLFFREDLTDRLSLLGGGGDTYFLSSAGIYKNCDDYDVGFIFPVKGTNSVLESNGSEVKLMDMTTCRIVKTVVTTPDEVPSVKVVDSFYPSSSGKSMIFSESYRSPSRDVIYIMDLESGNVRQILEGGHNATFSPDDQKIAYIVGDGIYVANADGTSSKLIVKIDWSSYRPANIGFEPYPFWSPDGKYLVYHKCVIAECLGENLSDFNIYKVDVNSSVEQKIVDGGLYPVWIK